MSSIHPDRGPAAAARLLNALEILKKDSGVEVPSQGLTVSELCRLAHVSRNAIYRHHPTVIAAVRAAQSGLADNPAEIAPVTPDYALLQDQLSKLAALVDHYYAAYREARETLERRDLELADLRRKLNRAPASLHR